ncbi:hypothetical protein [Streptomyces sp. NPDC050121]|uniref:hypothetical protein n=1 Tax=Streptomyces sp. NPDC050121 TaxID=3365601 RepID=UPI0037BDFA9A
MRLLQRSGIRVAGTAAVAVVLAVTGSVTAVPASAATPGSWTSVQPGVAQTGCDGVRATVALDANGALSLGATWNRARRC